MQFKLLASIAAISVLFSCNQSAEEQASNAVEAQRNADEKIAQAKLDGQDKVNAAQKEANEKIAQANTEAQDESSKAQQDANLDIRKANEESLKLRSNYQVTTSKAVSQIDNRIDSLKVKALTAKPYAKAQFEGAMPRVEAQRATVGEDLRALEGQSAVTFASYKTKTDQDLDELRKAVDEAAIKL